MFPAKIYIGQITIVFAIVAASTWGATQWTATALGFQARLGEPWFVVINYPVYLPWRLFEWWFAYEAYAPEIFEEGGAIAASGGVAGALFAIINSVWRARQNQLAASMTRTVMSMKSPKTPAGMITKTGGPSFEGPKDGDAMERAMAALANYRYAPGGEPTAPEGHPREWGRWLLEINSAEFDAIHDHVEDGDIVDMKPIN